MSNPAPTPAKSSWLDYVLVILFALSTAGNGASLLYGNASAKALVAKFDQLTGKVDDLASRLNPPTPQPIPVPVVPPAPQPQPTPPAPQPPAPQPQPVPVTPSITIPAGQTGPVLLDVYVGPWKGYSSVNGVQPGTYPLTVQPHKAASAESPEGN